MTTAPVVPVVPRPAPGRPPEYREATLPNGLRVLAARRAAVPVVELRLAVPFGGGTAEHAAEAELLAAALTCGAARRDRAAVEDVLAEYGGSLRVEARPERLKVTARLLSEGLPTLLDLLADLLTGTAFRAAEVETERARLLQRVQLAGRMPQYAGRTALLRHCFGEHPAARETPEAELVRAVAVDTLAWRRAEGLLPEGSTLVLVGDLTPERALAAAGRALAGWTGPGPAREMASPPRVAGGPVVDVRMPGLRQAEARLAAPSLPRTAPGFGALHLAELVFAGYFSSRLVRSLREEAGYAYSARCAVLELGATAVNLVQFGVDPRHRDASLDRTFGVLERLSGAQPPTPAEVEAAAGYSAGIRAISLATQTGLADALLDTAVRGLPPAWLSEFPASLAEVTVDQVAEAARVHLDPGAFTGIVLQP
ncbi:M16 family metallopeptidase [Actinacidiphila yeochonensis]|uniref:M16 family metallopeptidase n=1 Tax=Actinacidiphila yeochonensis TaxID=89050 RepID=UPI00068A3D84|nr:insulinase family protein [Actinacidiphila yeochonensis]